MVILFISNSIAHFLQQLPSFRSVLPLSFQKNNFIFTLMFYCQCGIKLCDYSNKCSWLQQFKHIVDQAEVMCSRAPQKQYSFDQCGARYFVEETEKTN